MWHKRWNGNYHIKKWFNTEKTVYGRLLEKSLKQTFDPNIVHTDCINAFRHSQLYLSLM